MKDIKHLLPITTNSKGTQVVSMRDMYDWLGIKSDFSHWTKRMIKYGFEENIDYIVYVKKDENLSGGRPSNDLAITLDMAKEVAMIQRTERGKQARQYFIESEKQLQQVKSQRIELPTTPQAMTKALLENMDANNEDIREIKTDVKNLKDNQVIQPAEYSNINLLVSKAVYNYIELRNLSLTKKQIGLLFKDIGHGIKQISGVRTRTQIRAKDAERVYQYIDAWTPSTATMINVKDMGTEQQDLKV